MHMILFAIVLVIFTALYGVLHYYLYRKLYALFPRQRNRILMVLLLSGASIFVAEWFVHQNIQTLITVPLTWFAFIWMGLVYLFFFVSLVFDAFVTVLRIARQHSVAHALAAPRRTAWVVMLVIGIAVYGAWSARQINLERISLVSAKLPRAVRMVQIADLHLGLLSDVRHVQQIVAAVNSLQPDIIVSTGDLVDMQMDHMPDLLKAISQLHARLGKYAVYGNHEYLAGIEASREFITSAGFTLLSDDGVTPESVLNIVGVDDPIVKRKGEHATLSESALLKQYANGQFTLLLKHQPRLDAQSKGLFDLQLSGHVHGGQIFPFGVLTWLAYRTSMGLSAAGAGAWLYVSRGAGTWGPPMRVLAPPEITVFDLLPAPGKD